MPRPLPGSTPTAVSHDVHQTQMLTVGNLLLLNSRALDFKLGVPVGEDLRGEEARKPGDNEPLRNRHMSLGNRAWNFQRQTARFKVIGPGSLRQSVFLLSSE